MPVIREPQPIWSDAPRYCPERPLPDHRFVPGLTPHPHTMAEPSVQDERVEYLPPMRWRENKLYLYGIDLYHQAYFWEAHEAWESLWHLTAKTNPEGQFFQGLIQNAASQLKRVTEQWKGMAHLSQEAYRRLQHVKSSGVCEQEHFMGINISHLLRAMEKHYGPVWRTMTAEVVNVSAPPPRLALV